jgi:hypothetical protein
MKPSPAQTMEELQGDNVNESAIAALTGGAADKEGGRDFVPTRDELAQLAKHRAAQAIRDQCVIFWGLNWSGADCRRIRSHWGARG